MAAIIQQAVILAAGLGSRFAPITSVIPKPMLPIGNRPTLDYVIAELLESGIKSVIIVVGHRKEIIQTYYQDHPFIQFVVQEKMNGTAPALYLAKELLQRGPFALCYSDEVMAGDPPCTRQLIDVFNRLGTADVVTGIEAVSEAKIRMYNSVAFHEFGEEIVQLTDIQEKPQGPYPSTYTAIGRYVCSYRVMEHMDAMNWDERGEGTEVYVTDVLRELMGRGNIYGVKYAGKRWDTGTKEGWLDTNIAMRDHQTRLWPDAKL
ncbi:sugar phosphate nucleotidyltransferase [Paenibacillus oryzisoli]|uniref:sugar phosphate nucleotidyltransferase n=1 Tax=Paenibacillus oryzisoli TaxID=1850517 RepID=UPI003D27AAEF